MNPFARPSFRPKKKWGFTLLEMMITMAIFIVLAAAVFGIIVGVMQSTSTLQDNQNHHDQISALNAFMKRQLQGLGSRSFLVSYRRGDGEGLDQNGIAFGGTGGATVLDAKSQANGYYTLRLGEIRFEGVTFVNGAFVGLKLPPGVVSDDDGSVEWTPLIRDVKRVDWKFQDFNTDQWLTEYANFGSEPNLVELSIQLAGDLQPVTMDFWLPHLSEVALALPQSPGASPANGANPASGTTSANGANLANGANPANGVNPANGTYPANNSLPAPGTDPANGANGTYPSSQNQRTGWVKDPVTQAVHPVIQNR